MSEIIVLDKTSKRGKEIEEHLRSINFEPWFSKIRGSKKTESEQSICPYRDQRLEKLYWKYSGVYQVLEEL